MLLNLTCSFLKFQIFCAPLGLMVIFIVTRIPLSLQHITMFVVPLLTVCVRM